MPVSLAELEVSVGVNLSPLDEGLQKAAEKVQQFAAREFAPLRLTLDDGGIGRRIAEIERQLQAVASRPITAVFRADTTAVENGARTAQAAAARWTETRANGRLGVDVAGVETGLGQARSSLDAFAGRMAEARAGLDDSAFRERVASDQAALSELAARGVVVHVGAEAAEFQRVRAEAERTLTEMSGQRVRVLVEADTSRVKAEVDALSGRMQTARLNLDDGALQQRLKADQDRLSQLAGHPVEIKIDAQGAEFERVRRQVESELTELTGRRAIVSVEADVSRARAELDAFARQMSQARLTVDDAALQQRLKTDQALLSQLGGKPVTVSLTGQAAEFERVRAQVVREIEQLSGQKVQIQIAGDPAQATGLTRDFQRSASLLSIGYALQQVTRPIEDFGRRVIEADATIDALKRGMMAMEPTTQAFERDFMRLREVARLPGLGFEEAIHAFIRLRAAGMGSEQVIPTLGAFANAIARVGGGKAELDRAALALTNMEARGRVTGQMLNMLVRVAPDVARGLKEMFGTADTRVLQKLGLDADTVIRKLTDWLTQLPRVTGGMKNALENLADSANIAFARIGKGLEPTLIPMIDRMGAGLERLSLQFQALSPGAQQFLGSLGLLAAGLAKIAVPLAAIALLVGQIGIPVALAAAGIAALGAAYLSNAGGFKDAIDSVFKPGLAALEEQSRTSFGSLKSDVASLNGLHIQAPPDEFTPALKKLALESTSAADQTEAAIKRIGREPPKLNLGDWIRQNIARPIAQMGVQFDKEVLSALDRLITEVPARAFEVGEAAGVAMRKAFINFWTQPLPPLKLPWDRAQAPAPPPPLTPAQLDALGRTDIYGGAAQAGRQAIVQQQIDQTQKLGAALRETGDHGKQAFDRINAAAVAAAQKIEQEFEKALKSAAAKLATLMAGGDRTLSLKIEHPDFSRAQIAELAAIDAATAAWEKLKKVQDEISTSILGLARRYQELRQSIATAFDFEGKLPKQVADLQLLWSEFKQQERVTAPLTQAAVQASGVIAMPSPPTGLGAFAGTAHVPAQVLASPTPPVLPPAGGFRWSEPGTLAPGSAQGQAEFREFMRGGMPPLGNLPALPAPSALSPPQPVVQFSTNASAMLASTLGQQIAHDPGVQQTCAEFVKNSLKAAGIAVPETNIAKDLVAQMVKGGQLVPIGRASQMVPAPGDILEWYGRQYGSIKDVTGRGYHLGIAAGAGMERQSSGGVVKTERIFDPRAATVFRLTGVGAGEAGAQPASALALVPGQEALRRAHKAKNDEVARGIDLATKAAAEETYGKQIQESARLVTQIALATATTDKQRISVEQFGQALNFAPPRVRALAAEEVRLAQVFDLTRERHTEQRIAIQAELHGIQLLAQGMHEAEQSMLLAQATTEEQTLAVQRFGQALDTLAPRTQKALIDEVHLRQMARFTESLKQTGNALAAANAPTAAQALAFTQLDEPLDALDPKLQNLIRLQADLNEQLARTVPIERMREALRSLTLETEKARLESERHAIERRAPDVQPGQIAPAPPLRLFLEEASIAQAGQPLRELEGDLGAVQQALLLAASGFEIMNGAALHLRADEIAARLKLIKDAAEQMQLQDTFRRETAAGDAFAEHMKRLAGSVQEAERGLVDAERRVAIAQAQRDVSAARRQGPGSAALAGAEERLRQATAVADLARAAQAVAGQTPAQIQQNVALGEAIALTTGDVTALTGAWVAWQAVLGVANIQAATDAVLQHEAALKKEAETTVNLQKRLDTLSQQWDDLFQRGSAGSRQLAQLEAEMGGFTAQQADMARQVIEKSLKLDFLRQYVQQAQSGLEQLFRNVFPELLQHTGRGFADLFKGILSGFEDMLQQMAAHYLASQFMRLVGRGLGLEGAGETGGGGGFLGNLLGTLAGAAFGGGGGGGFVSGATGTGQDIYSLAGFAGGGRPEVGAMSVVGERGPEFFVPDRPGTVLNPHELAAAMKAAGIAGGGDTININVPLPANVRETPISRQNREAIAQSVAMQLERSRRRNG